jgi:outer membrane protein TolC
MNKLKLVIVFSFLSSSLFAQDTILPSKALTLEDAISIALESNHNIKIANRTTEIASNNATLGNAGLLPTVSASGSYTGSVQDTEIRFAGGNPPNVNETGAGSNTLAGSITASYVLFDGFGNYYTFQNLKKLEEQSGVTARLQIEGTLIQVISQYLSVLLEKESLTIAGQSIARSLDRLQRVEERFSLGSSTRLDVLNAEVDLNADSVSYLQANARLNNAKRNLLIELGANPTDELTIDDEISINSGLQASDLLASSSQNSASLVLSRLASESAGLQLKQSRAGRFPILSLSGGYSYSESEFDAGFQEFQKLTGFNGGITLSVNLFNGFRRETQIQNAQVALKNNEESLVLAQKSVERDVMNLYEDYQTNLFLIDKEMINLETAELNFERSEQLFETGQITSTQFREAQLNISRVQQNIVRLKIQAKLAEIGLLQLAGQLIAPDS